MFLAYQADTVDSKGSEYTLREKPQPAQRCGSVVAHSIHSLRVDEFESRSSHFSFLLLTREIYAHASEHSRSRGCPFTFMRSRGQRWPQNTDALRTLDLDTAIRGGVFRNYS